MLRRTGDWVINHNNRIVRRIQFWNELGGAAVNLANLPTLERAEQRTSISALRVDSDRIQVVKPTMVRALRTADHLQPLEWHQLKRTRQHLRRTRLAGAPPQNQAADLVRHCPASQTRRTFAHCFSIRLGETVTHVPSCWANNETRSSSIIQRNVSSSGSTIAWV
jgi:hypothetical protein